MPGTAQIGVTGLGVMGRNLARNFARHGYTVAVHNRTAGRTDALISEFGQEGDFVPARTPEEFTAALQRPRRILVMVKAGPATDAVIEQFTPLLETGDVLMDGGNAHFADTRRRQAALRGRGLHFLGMGVSGGEEGALHGPSIMAGGSAAAYRTAGPMLEAVSARVDGEPCCALIGPDGAGHFTKMVHNGIEYADMQLIAEAYDLLRNAAGLTAGAIAEVFGQWQGGRLDSYLIGITAQILAHRDAAAGIPFVDVVSDQAEQKGTGRWTVQTALDLGVPVPGIAEAVFARSLSGQTGLRSAVRAAAGQARGTGPAAPKAAEFARQVEHALYASKIVSYAQGWHLMQAGAAAYGWDIGLGTIAAIWRGGCIIRAAFLDRVRAAYAADPDLPALLADPSFAAEAEAAQAPWRAVVAAAAGHGVPAPGLSAALAYYDALRAARLPAALIQAQRDFFGAHTYQRVDRPGTYHTRWSQDRAQTEVEQWPAAG